MASPVAFNTPGNAVVLNANGSTDAAETQSTFLAWNGNINNPDASGRPVAISSRIHVTPTGGAPAIDTDFHGIDLEVSADDGTKVNSTHSRIYAFESAAANNTNTTMVQLVPIYGLTQVGAGGASGGVNSWARSVYAGINLANGCTVANYAAFAVRSPFNSGGVGGTMANGFGLFIDSWTSQGNPAPTNAYSVFVNQGGGQLYTQENVVINNVGGQTNTTAPALLITTDGTKTAEAIRVTNGGTTYAVNIAHSAAQIGLVLTATSGTSGQYGAQINGYSHGLNVTTNASSGVGGVGLEVDYNAIGQGGPVLRLVGKGTGDHITITNGSATVFQVLHSGQIKNTASANEATGAGSAALGANCPAVTATAPYTWMKITTSDGSQGYIPVYK